MYRISYIFIFIICLTWGISLHATPHSDTVYIFFHRGFAVVDSTYKENRKTLEKLLNDIRQTTNQSSCSLTKLQLKGNSSPDGLTSANLRLTKKRTQTILQYLRNRVNLPDSIITVTANGIDWTGLAAMVENDSTCPNRNEVLNILHNTPEWIYDRQNRIIDGRKKQLMQLHKGIPYNYLSEKFFPALRNTCITIYYECNHKPIPESDQQSTSIETVKEIDKEVERPVFPTTSQPVNTPPSAKANSNHNNPQLVTIPNPNEKVEPKIAQNSLDTLEYIPNQRLAIKTNLLYDAVLMPALEIEYRINNRWSAAVEGSVAWWKNDGAHKYYQIATIIPEGRYWFRTKEPWHGHYVGLFVGGSWYDLENGSRGYKGEFVTTGISYGYMFPIGRSLSLEAGIGMGFLHTKYEEYLPIDGHYVYQQTSRTNWFGPVKLKFALVWRIWKQKNRGGDMQ